ncbi:MAG: hypothetical protein D3918_16060, partial [Candidatus Electrothrix sp. AX2]|nr:hypothetical protein [Candidatus Electrothrix gigas]
AVQDDGKILLTGTALGNEGRVVVLSRYQQDGSPDTTFADEGFKAKSRFPLVEL